MEANVLSLSDKRQAMTVVPRALRGLIGQVLGDRIRVDEVLGVGGMGVVFRGFHLSMDCPVAVKIALPQLGVGELVRFRREAELGGRLGHPNCLSVFELSTSANGQHYMVMPLLDGRPLTAYLDDRLPPEQVAAWGIQVLEGIAHAHAQGIIHRDVKPDNIMVCCDVGGEALLKIVDFGLAKLRADAGGAGTNSNTTMTGLMAGTPAYMAPEQALGLGCDERSDIYSIGMVLHQMATGYLPYKDDDAYDQLRSRLTEEVPALPGSVPAPLALIIGKALKGKKEHRYSTADEMREDLEAFIVGAVLPHAGNDALPPPPVQGEVTPSSPDLPIVEARPIEATGPQLPEPAPVVYADDDEDVPQRRGRGGTIMLAVVAILAVAAIPVALHYADEIEAVVAMANGGTAAPAEDVTPHPEAPPPSDGEANEADAQLAKLVDVERLTDAERVAAAQLAFATRDNDPCYTFADGLAFVERSHSKALLELLPRVGVPKGDGCEGLEGRVTAVLEQPEAPARVPAKATTPAKAAADRPAKSTARESKAGKRSKPPRSRPPSGPATSGPPAKKPPAKSSLPAAPRLDDGLRKPTLE